MALQNIPVDNSTWDYQYSAELDGTTYLLRFYWSQRLLRWTLDISDEFANPICMGIVLSAGVDLLAKFRRYAVPPGTLFLWDTTGQDQEADLNTFGTSVLLIYEEANA